MITMRSVECMTERRDGMINAAHGNHHVVKVLSLPLSLSLTHSLSLSLSLSLVFFSSLLTLCASLYLFPLCSLSLFCVLLSCHQHMRLSMHFPSVCSHIIVHTFTNHHCPSTTQQAATQP